MKEIRIDFIDFWPNIKKTDNYFYNLLSEHYIVIIDEENPELIFYSCFGKDHLKYSCKRILFVGENIRPDLTGADFIFSFDFISNKKHYRLPLYLLYIDDHKMNDKIYLLKSKKELIEIWNKKTKFCCMVVSNPRASMRIEFFKELSKIMIVDSGGKVLNNIGGRVNDKMEFINDYKFVISFENSLQNGYTTEKILEPIMTDSIPIYWGNEKIGVDFNTERFINFHDFNTQEQLVEYLIHINNNPEIAIEMLLKPVLGNENVSCLNHKTNVFHFIDELLKSKKKPRAMTYFELIHRFNIKIKEIRKSIENRRSKVINKLKMENVQK